MYSSRRSGPATDLHNAHTVSTLMRTMTTSGSSSHHPHRRSSRSKTNLNGTLPFRSSSIHQLEDRDRDNERHHRTCDNDRSIDVLTLEAKLKNNEKLIAHQTAEIEALRDANRGLERRLHELNGLKRDLSNKQMEERLKNDDLIRDLKDIDRLARKVQADKQYTVEAADRELTEAKMEIEHNHREMAALDTKLVHLTTENNTLIEELETTKNQFVGCTNEAARLQEFIERLQADKTKLSRRVSKLVHNEKELLQELQRCRRTTKSVTSSTSCGSLSKKLSFSARSDLHVKNIEDERDMYKNEVEILQKLLNERSRCAAATSLSPSRLRGRSLSPTAATRSAMRHDTTTSPIMQLIKRSASSCTTSPTRCTVCGLNRNRLSPTKDISAFEYQLKHLEEERDRLRRELHKCRRSAKEKDVEETQLARVMREKEDSQLLLNKFERHMAEIQGNIKVLTNERDNLAILYEQTKEELQKARHELIQSVQTSKVSMTAQSLLRKVENERDSAILEARTASTERDSLRERLRIATDTGLNERARNEQRIEDLEVELRKIEKDREEMIRQNHSLREQIKDLGNKLDEQTFTISHLNQELKEKNDALAHSRYLSEEAEQLVQENQRQLNMKKDELHSNEEKFIRLEIKIHELQETNKAVKDDFHIVRSTVQTLDKEKDRLCSELDLKADENLHLTQELSSRTRRIEELNLMVSELEAALDRSKDDTKQKLKEMTNLRIQIERNTEESNEIKRKLDLSIRNNERLQDEIAALTRENQAVYQDLQHSISDKDNLKSQVQEYIKQVSNCENVIAQKENDRSLLLDQYRETNNELNRLKQTLGDMESQANSFKQELQMKTADIKRYTERIEYLERDLQQHVSFGQEYEIQLSNINRTLQRNEEIIKKLQIDKQNLTNELGNIRDLNTTIDNKKEQIIRQLTSKDIENEQLKTIVNNLKSEIDMLRTQINNEKAVIKSLEELIASLRDKEFQIQLQAQERDADLHLIQDRANANDLKIQNLNKEIAVLKSQIIGLETENQRLKTLLTNERYEREQAAQDLRRLTDLTSHIDYESRYRSSSPRLRPSASMTNVHRSPGRSYSPARTDGSQTSPTKISISLKVSELDRSHESIDNNNNDNNN